MTHTLRASRGPSLPYISLVFVGICQLVAPCLAAEPAKPIDVGSRLELFVDDHLIDRASGDAGLLLHKPAPKEVVLVTDKPWEGNTSAYYTIFQDGDLYRMYYRGSHYDTTTRKVAHPEVTCYAESDDGVHWTKPNLGLFEFDGSKENNIVWDGIGTHCFTPFLDVNPACPPDARYKAIARGRPRGRKGLYAFKSADGIHWTLAAEGPVITEGAFDSQNLAFWDPVRKVYVDYHRTFRDGVRDIMTATSPDFLHWTDPVHLQYTHAPKEHLYTNAIRPYERAPHILIGFPTRYQPARASQVEPTLMTSRDGLTFRRWSEPLIPVTAPEDRDGNRSNYMTWGLVRLPGADKECSVYATEAYYSGPDSRVRRFTFRLDGFVSMHAGPEGGEIVTQPLTVAAGKLILNYVTAAAGSVQVEIQDADGTPLDGLTLDDCPPITGDEIDQPVAFRSGADMPGSRAIRVRFVLTNADLYSFRFGG